MRKPRRILLHGQQTVRQLRMIGRPSFSININRRVNLIECPTNLIHGLYVMDAHQVEAETVDMIFPGPIADRLNHETPHHRTFTSRFIATSGSIRPFPFLVRPVKIPRYRTFEIASFRDRGMIVHHVHHYPDTCPVKGHHHLLEFPDTHIRFVRVGGIRTFRHVIILRVITPVVLWFVELRLIHRGEIERRQQLYVGHPQFLQMVEPRFLPQISLCPLLRERQKLASVMNARYGINGKIPVMQFINNNIRKTLQQWTFVFVPALRVGGVPVDDSRPVTVHSHRLGKQSGGISLPYVVNLHVERVELPFQVFIHPNLPHPVRCRLHLHHPVGRASLPFLIKQHTYLLCRGSPKRELGHRRRIHHLLPITVVHRIFVERRLCILVRGCTSRCHCHH